MTPLRIKYLVFDPDRRGNERYYARRKVGGIWKKLRIAAAMPASGVPDAAFMAAYWTALATLDGTKPAKKVAPREDSFAWLWEEYQRSAKWKSFDPATKYDKRSVLGRFFETAGDLPYRRFRKKDVEASRDKRAATPAAADKLVKYLRALFEWAIEVEHAEANPAVGVKKLNVNSKGWHTWTPAEVDRFREVYPLGTKARLALELMLNTGARRSDAVRLGRQHEADGYLKWTAWKGRNINPTVIEVPLRKELRQAIDAATVGSLTYLVTEAGASFALAGFGNKFRDWTTAAGLPHCSAHGLRKAAATELAENGATAPELMAIFGWSRMETAEIYIRAANKKLQSGNAFARLDDYRSRRSVSLTGPKTSSETNPAKSKGKSNAER